MEGQEPRWYCKPAENSASTGTGGLTWWASSQSSAPTVDRSRIDCMQQSPSTSHRVRLVPPDTSGDWMAQHWYGHAASLGIPYTHVAHQPSLPKPTGDSDASTTAPLEDHRYQHRPEPQPQREAHSTFPTSNTTPATTATTTDRQGNGSTHRQTNEATRAAPYASPKDMTSFIPARSGWSSNAAAAPPSQPVEALTWRPSNTQSRPLTSNTARSPEPTQPRPQSRSRSQSLRQTPQVGAYDHPESPRLWTLERLASTHEAHLDRIRVLSSALGFHIRAHLDPSIELAFKLKGVIIRVGDLASLPWNHKVEGVLATTYVAIYGAWADYCAQQGIFELPILGSLAACWIHSLAPDQRVSATIVLEVIRFVTNSVFRGFERMVLPSVSRDATEWGWWDQVREECAWSLWSWHAVRQALSGSVTPYQYEILDQQSMAKERKMAEEIKIHRELAVTRTPPIYGPPWAPPGVTLQPSPTNCVISAGGATSSIVVNTATATSRNGSAHSLSQEARSQQRAEGSTPSVRRASAQHRPSQPSQGLPPAHPITAARQPSAAPARTELRPAPATHVATAQLASTNPGRNVNRISNRQPPAPFLAKPISPAAESNTTSHDPNDLYSDLTPAAFKQESAVFERASRIQKLINAHQLKRGQTPTPFEPIQMPQKRKRLNARVSAAVGEAAEKQRLAGPTQFIGVNGKGGVTHSQSIPRTYPMPPSVPQARPVVSTKVQVKSAPAAPQRSSGGPKPRYIPPDKPTQPFLPPRMYVPAPPLYPLPRRVPPPPMEHAFHDYTPSCQPLDCHLSLPARVELSELDRIFLHPAPRLPTASPTEPSTLGPANTFASPLHGLPDAAPFVAQTTTTIVHNWGNRASQFQRYQASNPSLDHNTINDAMLLQAESLTRVGKALMDLPHVERPARTVDLGRLSMGAKTQLFQLFALRALSAERSGEIPPIKTRNSKSKGSRFEDPATTGSVSPVNAPPVHFSIGLPDLWGDLSGRSQGQPTTVEQPLPGPETSASSKSRLNTPQAQTSLAPVTGSTTPLVVQQLITRGESLPAFARSKPAKSPSTTQPASASTAPGLARSASNGLVRNTSGKGVHPLLHFYSCVAPAQRQVARMLAQSPRSARPVSLPISHATEGSGPALPSPALSLVLPSLGVDLSENHSSVAPSADSGTSSSTSSTSIISPSPALDSNNFPPAPPAIQKKVDAKLLEFDRMVASGEMAGRVRDEHAKGLKEIIFQARIVEQRKLDLAQRAVAKAAAAAQTSAMLVAPASQLESAFDGDAAGGTSNALGLSASAPSTSFSTSGHIAFAAQPSGPEPVLAPTGVGEEVAPPSLGVKQLAISDKGPSSDPVLSSDPVEPSLPLNPIPVSERLPPTNSEISVDQTVAGALTAAESPPKNDDGEEIDQLASDRELDHPSAQTPYSPALGAPPEHDQRSSRDPPPPPPSSEFEKRAPISLERRDSTPDVPLSRIATLEKRRESAPLRSSVESEIPRPFIIANQPFKPFGSLD
ncbi:BZ3500_MvSof-1268-A1-R1_Chr1-3g01973 [Microbotryum saponariae]|uniref:BZ3500_MvSof-1268-A1-R1_Chr1-3g01973 protein n=1 Tax=Microbotryum saponariae TaxID=289078 RepID=A0A2X0L433_9BASI|nr:BZ3500_MvSof-1268-A1-R1_Chr1-3g01973 [Microbotryum saponariae]SCZ95064.1 BZ3501_MvSof-1269-A2-R1_Chr1-3g01575 [Microbotryum saponariae]